MKIYHLILMIVTMAAFGAFSSAMAEEMVGWGYYYNGNPIVFSVRKSAVPLLNKSFELNTTGKQYAANDDYSTALQYYFEALELRKQAVGENHPFTASILNNIGLAYRHLNQITRAEQYLKQAVEIQLKSGEPDSDDRKMAVNNLLKIYQIQGKKDEINTLKQRAGLK